MLNGLQISYRKKKRLQTLRKFDESWTVYWMKELIGHFMIHIVLLTFIIEGVSFYKPPVTMHKTTLEQMVFVSINFIFTLATFMLIYYRFA